MKFAVIALLFSTAPAHAELLLSPQQLEAKSLQICRNVESIIEESSDVANHFSASSDAAAAASYQKMQADLTVSFGSLDCEKRLTAAAQAAADLKKQCNELVGELEKLSDKLDDMALRGLEINAHNQSKFDAVESQMDSIRAKYKKLGCVRSK